jgi:hypothetical protein
MPTHSLPQVADEAGALLERARAADAASPEPLQALASLRWGAGPRRAAPIPFGGAS